MIGADPIPPEMQSITHMKHEVMRFLWATRLYYNDLGAIVYRQKSEIPLSRLTNRCDDGIIMKTSSPGDDRAYRHLYFFVQYTKEKFCIL